MGLSPAAAGRLRALQSITTPDGLVLLLEPGNSPELVGALSAHVSGVWFADEAAVTGAIETETLPGSVGFVCDVADVSPPDARAIGAAGGVVVSNPETEASELASAVAELHALGLAAIVDVQDDGDESAETSGLVGAVKAASQAEPDLIIVSFPAPPSVDDPEQWVEACAQVDSACASPWLLATRQAPFALALRQVRAAALAGSSGHVLTPSVFDQPDDTLARALQLFAAQRRGVAAWDAASFDAAPDTGEQRWFGVRTFVHHGDVDRLEERLVIHRAATSDEALALGQTEADEYAAAFGGEAVDAAQVYEVSHAELIEASGGGFATGIEVYSQLRPVGGDVDEVLESYFD